MAVPCLHSVPGRRLAAALLFSCALLLGGCPSLPLNQSAQTLPAGRVQHGVGLEWFGVKPTVDDASTPEDERELFVLPLAIPMYWIRIGLANRLDFGARTNVFGSNLQLDFKVMIVDTDRVDLSVNPTFQWAWLWGYGHLPVLLGINPSDSVEIVLSGRVAVAFLAVDTDSADDDLAEAVGAGQLMTGGGIGLYLRVSDSLALAPEVQVLYGFGERDPILFSFNVGVSWGNQGHEPPPPPPGSWGSPQQQQPYGPQPYGPQPGPPPSTPAGYSPPQGPAPPPPGYAPPGAPP